MEIVRPGYAPHKRPHRQASVSDNRIKAPTSVLPRPWPEAADLDRGDGLIAFIASTLVAVACFSFADTLPPFLLRSMDFWFEADTLREVSNMTRVHDDHYRTSVHPLFSLTTFVPVYVVKHVLSASPLQAVLVVTSAIGGLWAGMLYFLLRLLGCLKLDAAVFTLLGLCSASAFFWLPVPNAYSWGSLSLMGALMLLLYSERHRVGATAYVVVSAITLSVTVTNWMAGLLVAVVRWPWKQAAQLSINALCLVVLLWGVQKFIFPTAEFFIGSRGETSFVHHPQAGGPFQVASSFVFHSVIAPAVRLIQDDAYTQGEEDTFRLSERLTFQFATPGSAGPLGLLAVGLWSALLLNGCWRLVTLDRHGRFRMVLGLLLVFELALHLLYGEETFTYSLHFIPLLVALAALGAISPGRVGVLVLAVALTVCTGVNNWQQLTKAVESATQFSPQRQVMTDVMQRDPKRPWPRSAGHIPLTVPGQPERSRAYYEPGGDFSPQVPSFGVSLWLCDESGLPIINSNTVPLHEIQQEFVPSMHPHVPAIVTRTPYYDATWSRLDATRWELRFTNHTHHAPAILIRSVGPAGGPVTSLAWDGMQVAVNQRWTVSATPAPALVVLGDENDRQWMTAQSPDSSWHGESGWGFARLSFRASGDEIRIVLNDLRAPFELPGYFPKALERPRVTLPDPRFQASMDAQVTHLMMSLVDDETRPGDPVSFYRAWQRQGSYIMAALARAGDPQVSRVLSTFIARHDLGGGSGPEADAAGLEIWALTEAAKYIADHVHDEWLWPHIVRKAERIERMRTTGTPLLESFVVPSPKDFNHLRQTRTALLAQPGREGLIVGRVGNEWPLSYVNATGYRGLLDAAAFAERLGKRQHATRWRAQAEELQDSWERRFQSDSHNVPSIAAPVPSATAGEPLATYLGQPLATYHYSLETPETAEALARAHQALRAGQPAAVWATLRNLWRHQASPGLYTWDLPRPTSGDIADGWQYARGWRNESVISPDYGMAALLLLLQQDFLAYVSEEATVVIGGGIIPALAFKTDGSISPGNSWWVRRLGLGWSNNARHPAWSVPPGTVGLGLSGRNKTHSPA